MQRRKPVRRQILPLLQLLAPIAFLAMAYTTNAHASKPILVKSYVNDTVLLNCHVEDLGLQTRVRWFRGGQLIADSEAEPKVIVTTVSSNASSQTQQQTSSSSGRVKMWSNRSLELSMLQPEDSGEYVCQATRPEPWGKVTHVHHIQVVYPAIARPIPDSGDSEVTLNKEAILSCSVEGEPLPTVTWTFEGKQLQHPHNLQQHEKQKEHPEVHSMVHDLRFLASNSSLAGVYTCHATNGLAEPSTANIRLNIRHAPLVRALSHSVYGSPGVRVRLECAVAAWPEADLHWYFEGKPLHIRSSRYQRRSEPASTFNKRTNLPRQGRVEQIHSLLIKSVIEGDLGDYSCRANNSLGMAEGQIRLTALPRAPQLRRQVLRSLMRQSGGIVSGSMAELRTASFVWEVDSYSPIVQYQFLFRRADAGEEWRRLVVPSESELETGPLHARLFKLTGLEPEQVYEAFVLARNKYGWSEPSRIVRFTSGPVAPSEEEEESYKMDSVGHEEIPSAVQVTSDSHRSSIEASSSESSPRGDSGLLLVLLLTLSLLFYAGNETSLGSRADSSSW